MSNAANLRLLALRDLVVQKFSGGDWREVGLITKFFAGDRRPLTASTKSELERP